MAVLFTKTVVIIGYCTVIYCTARFTMEQQERTRLFLLSPETNPEKIKDPILLKIEKESNRKTFKEFGLYQEVLNEVKKDTFYSDERKQRKMLIDDIEKTLEELRPFVELD